MAKHLSWLVPVVVVVLGGGIGWLTKIHSLASANAAKLESVEQYTQQLEAINTRLSRIEGALGVQSE